MSLQPIPRLPVFGWATLSGARRAGIPCLLSLPRVTLTTSGRAAILLGLEALGVGPGDRVLVPSYHTPTMVAPVVHLKGIPVFYPIDRCGAPALAWMESQDLRGVKVLLVVHLFGLPQPMADIRRWCDERRIALIEDCAHALFGRSGDRSVGAWGDIAVGSLTKFLPLATGGCLVINGLLPAPRLEATAPGAAARLVLDSLEVGAMHGRLTGLNGAVTGLLAAVRGRRNGADGSEPAGLASTRPDLDTLGGVDDALAHRAWPRVGAWLARHIPRGRIVERRRQRYRQLSERLVGHIGMRPVIPVLPEQCAPYVFPLWVHAPDPGYATLRRLRMPVSRWNWLWPGVPPIEGDQGIDWSNHVLQLACHQDLSDRDLERLVAALIDLYGAAPSRRVPPEMTLP